VAGLLIHEAIAFLRALRGIKFTGYDIVEVAPAYDTQGQTTALAAANIGYELLTLTALAKQQAG
jgi:agmatinase